jgi:hypothetical protein
LKSFTCQEGTYYFDNVKVEHSENQLILGAIQMTLNIRYVTDNAPVEDAGVMINGSPCEYEGGGVYTINLPSLLPMTSLESLIQVDGKVIEQINVTTPMFGNIIVMVLTVLVIALVFTRLKKRGQIQVNEPELVVELKGQH